MEYGQQDYRQKKVDERNIATNNNQGDKIK
jgi:hypothetical protein